MNKPDAYQNPDEEVETALLDAELFVKYGAPNRAMRRLQSALERHPRAVALREKLREVAAASKHPEEAARQCLALASLYIAREDFEAAHARLLEAKQLDPRISITTGLDAIRRARRPQSYPIVPQAAPAPPPAVTFAGDLAVISIFDAVQVIENSRLTGALKVTSDKQQGCVFFNEGRIVGAEAGTSQALEAFRAVVEVNSGTFDFKKSAQEFPVTINAASNTNLILDTLRQLDEEKQ